MRHFVAAESVPYGLSLRVITEFPRSEEFQLTCTSQPGLKEGYYAHARKVADVNCKRELIVYLREKWIGKHGPRVQTTTRIRHLDSLRLKQ